MDLTLRELVSQAFGRLVFQNVLALGMLVTVETVAIAATARPLGVLAPCKGLHRLNKKKFKGVTGQQDVKRM